MIEGEHKYGREKVKKFIKKHKGGAKSRALENKKANTKETREGKEAEHEHKIKGDGKYQ